MQSTMNLPSGISAPKQSSFDLKNVHSNDDDVFYLDDDPQDDPTFVDEYRLGEPLFALGVDVGRDWESVETEDGFTINTAPNQTLFVYEGNEMDYIIAHAAAPPLNIVAIAQGINGNLVDGLTQLLYIMEQDVDGIEDFKLKDVTDEYIDVARRLELRLQALLDAAEDDESYSAFDADAPTA